MARSSRNSDVVERVGGRARTNVLPRDDTQQGQDVSGVAAVDGVSADEEPQPEKTNGRDEDPEGTEEQHKKDVVITVPMLFENCCDEAKCVFSPLLVQRGKVVQLHEVGKVVNGKRINSEFFVVAVLYRITHVKHDAPEAKEMYPSKKPKRDYNRMLFFGLPNGETFTAILQSSLDANVAMKHCRNYSICVGRPFALYEPRIRQGNGVRKEQVTVLLTSPIIPMKLSFVKYLPLVVDVNARPNEGEERFFLVRSLEYKGARYPKLSAVKVKSKDSCDKACCNGYMCDRQVPFQVNQCCGCFQVHRNISGIVLEYDVDFCEPMFHSDGSLVSVELQYVEGQRSFRTTKLLLASPEDLNVGNTMNDTEKNILVNEKVEELVDFVNENGGFTVMGYKSIGAVNSGIDGVKNDSELTTYHVVYLYPTRVELVDTEAFKQLQFRMPERTD